MLDAAFALLGHEQGLSARIEEICDAAGVSRDTFHRSFNGVPDVFGACPTISHDFNLSVTGTISLLPEATERVAAAMRYYLARAVGDPRWA